jgi:tRNA G18 (ribose-2'-O)-methylase SpoU
MQGKGGEISADPLRQALEVKTNIRRKEISSKDNPDFRRFLKLTTARDIRKHGLALLSGPRQVRELLREMPEVCAGLILSHDHAPPAAAVTSDIPLYCLKSPLFRKIDLHGTGHPVLLVHVPPFTAWTDAAWPAGCTLCVPFQDPTNVGAVIRSAAAFGVSRVVILEEAAHPFHPKSVRAAGTTLFRVPLLRGPSLYGLKITGVPVVTLSPEGKDVGGYVFPPSFCMVPGLEGPGLPEHLRNGLSLSIPMTSREESLNAATATGIVLYVWQHRLRSKS